MDGNNIEKRLNYIERKINERTAISNLSNFANVADKITHGNISIEIDSVNKIINFGYGTNKIWFNVSAKTLNNVNSILFNSSRIDGLMDSNTFSQIDKSNIPDTYANYAVSVGVAADILNKLISDFAPKIHKHLTDDIYRIKINEEEQEEEEFLEDILAGKSDVGHTHSISDVSNLQTALDGKASTNHTHTLNDV